MIKPAVRITASNNNVTDMELHTVTVTIEYVPHEKLDELSMALAKVLL